jgi:hypothetical protein
MFAVIAIVLFLLGGLLVLLEEGSEWVLALLFFGLASLSVHLVWAWAPWRGAR